MTGCATFKSALATPAGMAWLLLVAFLAANITVNVLTRGRLVPFGIDFVVPTVILVSHEAGVLTGLVAALLMTLAHFGSVPARLHLAPAGLVAGCVTAVAVGILRAGPLPAAALGGLAVYHAVSAAIVAKMGALGPRYLLFVFVNAGFSLWVLTRFF